MREQGSPIMLKRSLRLVAVVVVFLQAGLALGQEKKPDPPEQEACARACAACALECEACYRHCLAMVAAGDKKHAAAMRVCQDCAAVCALTGRVVARRGPSWPLMCEVCAKLCKACNEQCGKFDHEQMKKCARACTSCEKACRDHLATIKKKVS
jgi:hypothetical protein